MGFYLVVWDFIGILILTMKIIRTFYFRYDKNQLHSASGIQQC